MNALDRALRDALVEIHPHLRDIDLVNFKVRILDETKGTGAVTRVLLDASDGDQVWGSIGVSENIIEASWEALVDSLEYGMRVSRPPVARRGRLRPEARDRSRRSARRYRSPVPCWARPRSERVLEVLRSGRLSLGPLLGEFEREFADASRGVSTRARSRAEPPGCISRCGRWASATAMRSITTPFSFVASANVVVYERARPVFADIDPATFNLDPDAAAAAVTERTTALLPVHMFGYPADIAAFERLGLPIVEDACEALGAVDADGVPVGGRGHPAVFGFYANKQLTTGEGGMVTTADAEVKERIDSERNQGRAPNMDWLDHDRLGFNYRLSDIACALGLAQLERVDEMLAGRAQVADRYRAALGGIEELDLPCPDSTPPTPGAPRLVRVRRPAAAEARSRRGGPSAARARHPEQAVLPGGAPDELLPRAVRAPRGRVPGVRGRRRAARSRCRSSPTMTESQVEQVAESARDSASGR